MPAKPVNIIIATIAFCGIVLAAASISAPAVAEDSAFSPAQKKEMGKFIRDYLVGNPEVLREAFLALEKKEAKEKSEAASLMIKENADAIFRSKDAVVVGNPDGDVTLVEFFDYNCGFCKRALDDLLKLVEEDKKLRVVLKEYPILSKGSLETAKVSIAAGMQGKYMEFHIAMLRTRGSADKAKALRIAKEVGLDIEKLKKDMEKPEIINKIAEDRSLARALGINGTPAYVVDTEIISGAIGAAGLRAQIKKIRSDGCKTC